MQKFLIDLMHLIYILIHKLSYIKFFHYFFKMKNIFLKDFYKKKKELEEISSETEKEEGKGEEEQDDVHDRFDQGVRPRKRRHWGIHAAGTA